MGSTFRWILGLVLLAVAGFFAWKYFAGGGPSIAFAPIGDSYSSRVDFAELERLHPLTAEDRAKITPENITKLNQEQLDQIYGRISSGPIPNGFYRGDLLFTRGVTGRTRINEIIGEGLKGSVAGLQVHKLEALGRALWKGKHFYHDQRVLRNRIEHLDLLKEFFPDPADQARLTASSGEPLYFPAKLYCGQSLLDSRRESVIIDYAFTDELDGYRAVPDKLAGREGLTIRDEIRMIRPGFYLGRAYASNTFLLNFFLYNEEVAKAGGTAANECWSGPQTLAQAQ